MFTSKPLLLAHFAKNSIHLLQYLERHAMSIAPQKPFKSLQMLNTDTVEITLPNRVIKSEAEVDDMFAELDAFVSGRSLKRLLIMGDKTNGNKIARLKIIAENTKRKTIVKAEAILVKSFAHKLASNFYMFFQDHIYPMRYFNKRQEAEKWLRKF